jgi:YegS/Rv2252/BmrU family lipid kinase
MTTTAICDDSTQIVAPFDRAVVFTNANAGHGKSRKFLPALKQEFQKHAIIAQFQETSSRSDLESQAAQAIQNGERVLLAVVGDGTLQGLVNAANGRDVLLGVIPAGGGNDFARALGFPINTVAAFHALLRGEPRAVDLVRIRTNQGQERLYLGGGGIGLDADAARLAGTRYRNWPGRLRYLSAAVDAYLSHKPRRIRVAFDSADGAEAGVWQDAILACVLNTPAFGAGIRLSPHAHINDGLLDFAFLEKLSFSSLLRILPRLALRGTLHLQQLRIKQFRAMSMETDPPVAFYGDGELLGMTPVKIEVLPAAAKFLAPRLAKA